MELARCRTTTAAALEAHKRCDYTTRPTTHKKRSSPCPKEYLELHHRWFATPLSSSCRYEVSLRGASSLPCSLPWASSLPSFNPKSDYQALKYSLFLLSLSLSYLISWRVDMRNDFILNKFSDLIIVIL